MKTALFVGASLVLGLSACGGSDGTPPTQKSFDQGTEVPPATGTPSAKVVPYPAGPFGVGMGSVVANMKFRGWVNPDVSNYDAAQFTDIDLAQYYNPDGTGPIKAIYLSSAAVWCTACQEEYQGTIGVCSNDETASCISAGDCGGATCDHKMMADHYTEWKDKGVVFIGTIFEDGKNPPNPAKAADLAYWGEKYNVNFPLVLDPLHKMAGFFTSDVVPMGLVIDTKTMKITTQIVGGDPGGVIAGLEAIVGPP
jgi:hypothetical protein